MLKPRIHPRTHHPSLLTVPPLRIREDAGAGGYARETAARRRAARWPKPQIILCAHAWPLATPGLAKLLDGYAVSRCEIGARLMPETCVCRADLAIRCGRSTHSLGSGLRCAKAPSPVPVLFISEGWLETEAAARAAGIQGYLGPRCTVEHLRQAVAALLRGETYYHPGDPEAHAVDLLTRQQVRVLRKVGLGYTDQEIAGRLGVSERTVRHHLEALYRKLWADRRADLAARAGCGGLV